MPITFWGTAFFFVAEALEDMNSGAVAWLRISLGFIFFALLPVKAPKHSIGFKDWVKIAILGVVWIGIPFTLFAIAQQWIDSSVAGMLIGAQPIFASAMASLFLLTLPSKRSILGLCLGLTGVILTAWPNLGSNASSTWGIVLVLTAVLCYGFSGNFVISLTQQWGSYFLTLRVLLIASIFTLPYGIYGLLHTDHTLKAYGSVAILGIGATAITPFIFSILSSKVGATRANSINFMIPLVSLYMGAFVRDEMIHGLSLIGLAITLTGLGVMGGADNRH